MSFLSCDMFLSALEILNRCAKKDAKFSARSKALTGSDKHPVWEVYSFYVVYDLSGIQLQPPGRQKDIPGHAGVRLDTAQNSADSTRSRTKVAIAATMLLGRRAAKNSSGHVILALVFSLFAAFVLVLPILPRVFLSQLPFVTSLAKAASLRQAIIGPGVPAVTVRAWLDSLGLARVNVGSQLWRHWVCKTLEASADFSLTGPLPHRIGARAGRLHSIAKLSLTHSAFSKCKCRALRVVWRSGKDRAIGIGLDEWSGAGAGASAAKVGVRVGRRRGRAAGQIGSALAVAIAELKGSVRNIGVPRLGWDVEPMMVESKSVRSRWDDRMFSISWVDASMVTQRMGNAGLVCFRRVLSVVVMMMDMDLTVYGGLVANQHDSIPVLSLGVAVMTTCALRRCAKATAVGLVSAMMLLRCGVKPKRIVGLCVARHRCIRCLAHVVICSRGARTFAWPAGIGTVSTHDRSQRRGRNPRQDFVR
ncbi:hypothetical protein B0T20DRAFT_392408 [Sordaria brevicollis]|uniref:Uncharacterized protein n=1 Tax=Sordaria brevicollis TaxID=83679 RepID=A0AAE0UCU2_SORBR|nr:hypothetical protein B0T20DRAFT_392408 [Sordaria brevicollis]